MRHLLVLFVLSSTVLSSAVPAFAQPAAAQPQDRREKIKQRIRAMRAYTLTEQLDLDEATAAKLFPALAKYDDEFDKLLLARTDLQRRLEAAGTIKDPKEIDKLVDEAVANQKALWTAEEQRLAQLRKILTPAQTARVLVVLPQMERKIQNQLKRAAQPGANAAPKARKGADPGGDLGTNPFGKSGGSAVDPFERRPSDRRPANRDVVCDPFSTPQGCRK
jgi:Spy/CpxP family protein refolding chaperone